MKTLAFFWLLVIYSLPTTAQLKYRAEKDFRLKGNVKIIIENKLYNKIKGDSTIADSTKNKFITYEFSKEGFLKKRKVSNYDSIVKTEFYNYYDSFIKITFPQTSSIIIAVLNKDGNITAEIKLPNEELIDATPIQNLKDKGVLFGEYNYNKKGRLKEKIDYDASGNVTSKFSYKYNLRGLVREIEGYDSTSISATKYKYNLRGKSKILKSKFFLKKLGSQFKIKTRYRYNIDHKNRAEKVKFKYKPRYKYSRGETKHLYFYDELHNLLRFSAISNKTLLRFFTYEIEYYP